MCIEQLPLEIKKCFMKELEQLVSKYSLFSSYAEETINKALMLLENFQGTENLDINYLLEIVKTLQQTDEKVLEYYLWNKSRCNDLSIEEAQVQIRELNNTGFIFQDDELIYFSEEKRSLKKEVVERLVENSYGPMSRFSTS